MSKSTEHQWLEFESPWACQPGKVRVLQPAGGVSRDELVKRAGRDEIARPYIFETPFERRMHFSNEATQRSCQVVSSQSSSSMMLCNWRLFNQTINVARRRCS